MKFIKHLKKIIEHKRNVAYYCFMCGLYWQGIIHDLSKFSPTEFGESVQYYVGNDSPINVCKKLNGYSNAWFHHKGRNKHHWEYWVDNLGTGMTAHKMPYKYALEMVCDYLGAGRAYVGKDKFTIDGEYGWWLRNREKMVLHPDTRRFIDTMFTHMKFNGIKETLTDKTYMKRMKANY